MVGDTISLITLNRKYDDKKRALEPESMENNQDEE